MNRFGEMRSSHSIWLVTIHIWPSSLAVHEAKVHHDANAYPRSKTNLPTTLAQPRTLGW